MPKVSICIPAYEEPATLKILLDSISVQTFRDYEVVITDDSSGCAVEQVVEASAVRSSIRYYRNGQALGSPENWNAAMGRASGEYIKIMHHDDWFSHERSLLGYVAMLEFHEDVEFAFSAGVMIHRDGSEGRIHRLSKDELRTISRNPDALYYKGLSIGSPSQTIHRKSLGLTYDRKLKWLVDIDFYIRAVKKNRNIRYMPDPLVCVSDLSRRRVTRYVEHDARVNVCELIHMFKKLETKKASDYKYFFFILKKLASFRIRKKAQLIGLGVDGEVPRLVLRALALSNMALALKKIAGGRRGG